MSVLSELSELERQAKINGEQACYILGNTYAITFNDEFQNSCKLGLLAIRLLQRKEENANSKDH